MEKDDVVLNLIKDTEELILKTKSFTAIKIFLAESFLESKHITTPEEYFDIINWKIDDINYYE